ncbi:MAG: hypothetical protein IKN83_07860 [Bacteroidaceae bacterium]|nr:hypothetical protein [Bacteroidaceae bacterium]
MGKVFIKVKQQYFRPEDKQMWFTKSITYTKIGFDTLVKHVSADSGMSEAACEGAIRSIFKQVEEMVLNGHTINIKQLGTLKMGISAKAPLDQEEAGAKQIYRRRLLYYPSTIIKDEIDNTQLVTVTPLS